MTPECDPSMLLQATLSIKQLQQGEDKGYMGIFKPASLAALPGQQPSHLPFAA